MRLTGRANYGHIAPHMRTAPNFINRVETLRRSAGLSKTKLALHLGLTLKQYQRMLQGSRELRAEELWRAAGVFQRTMDSFCEKENDSVSVPPTATTRAQIGG
jgi:transcriptional regulator with XRE-family HTH domain